MTDDRTENSEVIRERPTVFITASDPLVYRRASAFNSFAIEATLSTTATRWLGRDVLPRRRNVANGVEAAGAPRPGGANQRSRRPDTGEVCRVDLIDRGEVVHVVEVER